MIKYRIVGTLPKLLDMYPFALNAKYQCVTCFRKYWGEDIRIGWLLAGGWYPLCEACYRKATT